MTTTIIVPCYNEEKRIDLDAFRRFVAEDRESRFLLVNDGSRDGTSAMLHALASELPGRIEVLDLARNSGKAEAVRQGMSAAAKSDAQFVGFWDADLATPLDEVDRFRRLLEKDEELEIVFGSRVKLMGRSIERRASRHYIGRIAATGISTVLGLAIYDTQCGAKMFRRNAHLAEVFATPFLTRWLFDVEIVARYRRLFATEGKEISRALYELPLQRWRDVEGSKVGATDFLRSGLDLLKIWRHY